MILPYKEKVRKERGYRGDDRKKKNLFLLSRLGEDGGEAGEEVEGGEEGREGVELGGMAKIFKRTLS